MDSSTIFAQEEFKKQEYQSISLHMDEQNQTESAYGDLNSRYLKAYDNYNQEHYQDEIGAISMKMSARNVDVEAAKQKWQKKFKQDAEQRIERKKQIEAAWHKNTSAQKKELEKRKGKGSAKEAGYYANYNLKELEIFIKNSDRGGNSQEYNDVATDLEVYNRVMSNEGADPNEGIVLLKRLQESCNTYLTTRKKTFWRSGTGKIRRAIIESISLKVNESIQKQTAQIMEENEKAKTAYESEKSEENINAALKTNYDLIYQVMNGTIELTEEQMKALDVNATKVMEDLRKCKVDENQGDNLCSRFFNALGWSGSKARIVDDSDLGPNGAEMKKSPIKRKMFHSMNPYTKKVPADPETGEPEKTIEISAIEMAKQLAGMKEKNGRLFYGLGRFGKGVYTSAMNDHETSSEEFAWGNSWGYGWKKDAAMVIMTLNENARIADYKQVRVCIDMMKEKFPKLHEAIIRLEETSKAGYNDYETIFAAFFGYNTIRGFSGVRDGSKNKDGLDDVDYYTTTNQKALSISELLEIRKQEKENNVPTRKDHIYKYSITDDFALST